VTDGQSAYQSWCRAPLWDPWPDFTFSILFFQKIALLFVLGRPLWREDESVICSAICQWPESRRTHNHTLLSHLRLMGSLSVASYNTQGLRWKYSNPPPHRDVHYINRSSKLLYDCQSVSHSVSMSWCRAPLWDLQPDITSCRYVSVWKLRSCFCGAPSLTRGRVCNLQCNHSVVLVAQNPWPYFTVSSETPSTWRARFPYLYPQEQGGPVVPPALGSFYVASLTRGATAEVL
jgi:hypothetical protein